MFMCTHHLEWCNNIVYRIFLDVITISSNKLQTKVSGGQQLHLLWLDKVQARRHFHWGTLLMFYVDDSPVGSQMSFWPEHIIQHRPAPIPCFPLTLHAHLACQLRTMTSSWEIGNIPMGCAVPRVFKTTQQKGAIRTIPDGRLTVWYEYMITDKIRYDQSSIERVVGLPSLQNQ